ncbi:MAG: hypothetical protein J6T01_03860 [Kiritimatiellae bacterium]|nr:hypothetical protein [Kiritimatiellia bacterium]
MTDAEWAALVAEGSDEGWKLVWERVVEPESRSMRSAELMKKYSITAGDIMGMMFDEMVGRGKIALYRGSGSFEGWLRRYARGFVLNANPAPHGEISIEGAHDGDGEEPTGMDLPTTDKEVLRKEVWDITHRCFLDLWMSDPERAYVHLLKTRFMLSSEEVKNFLDVSSTANVDQIFSRNIKFMRERWRKYDSVSKD